MGTQNIRRLSGTCLQKTTVQTAWLENTHTLTTDWLHHYMFSQHTTSVVLDIHPWPSPVCRSGTPEMVCTGHHVQLATVTCRITSTSAASYTDYPLLQQHARYASRL